MAEQKLLNFELYVEQIDFLKCKIFHTMHLKISFQIDKILFFHWNIHFLPELSRVFKREIQFGEDSFTIFHAKSGSFYKLTYRFKISFGRLSKSGF